MYSFTVTYTCDSRLKVMSNSCMSRIKLNMVFQGCLAVLTVHIRCGQIVLMCGVVNSREGKTPNMSYVVNGNEYKYMYYLGDRIYPEYAKIVMSYSFLANEKQKLFKLAQESAKKDVERAF
uniref:Uncharacterized protein n=1 Tax=Lactuca sativa TaxID=4236 RepID=A0A9R1WVB8_LACSA|nr:hypothetical protein LSAT_V11C900479230 [Lactuca sativa]